MSNMVDFGGLGIAVEPALVCECVHDTCWKRQGDRDHYERCECPKAQGLLAVLAVDSQPFPDWDSIQWGHLTKTELLRKLDDLRILVESLPESPQRNPPDGPLVAY